MKIQTTREPEARQGKMRDKRSYRRPQLLVYGDIREITQTVFKLTGNTDMAGGPFKTSGIT